MVTAACAALDDACSPSKCHEARVPDVGRGRRGTIGLKRHRPIHAGFLTGFNHGGLSRAPLQGGINPYRRVPRLCGHQRRAPGARGEIPGEGGGGIEGGPVSGMAAIADLASSRAYRDRYRQPFLESSHRAILGNLVYNGTRSSIF